MARDEEKPIPVRCEKCQKPRPLVASLSQGWAAQCHGCGHIWNCWFRDGDPHP